MAEHQEEFINMPIRDEIVNTANGEIAVMTSAWEFSPRELERIRRGAKIYLSIVGKIHPPVRLSVEELK